MCLRQQQSAALGLALAGFAPAAFGQWNPATRFGPTPPTASADYGRAAAIDGDWAVVGAHRFGTSPSQAGAAFLYQRSGLTWSAAGMLQASDRTLGDDFGGSVSVRGAWLAVGAPLDDPHGTNSGAAYLFQNGSAGWSQFVKLSPSDGASLDQFGFSTALVQDWAMVGAPFDDDGGADSGATYLYHFDGQTWAASGKLTHSPAGDQFGTTLSASGDALAIGAPMNDGRGADAGAVYVYRRNGATWELEATLHASDGVSGDRFGGALSLDGDTLLIAAWRDDRPGMIDAGAAYVFRRTNGTWSEEAKLTPADAAAGDFFGMSVSLRGDAALIGSNFDDDRGINSGSAYFYAFSNGAWQQMHKFVADDGASQDWFGSSVALGDFVAVIGAPGDDEGADAAGSMYLYAQASPNSPPTCTLPAVLEVECSGTTTSVALDGSGASDPDQDELGFTWSADDARATFDDPHAVAPNLLVPSGLGCPFTCGVTLTVSDPEGETAECHMDVTVSDTAAPALTCPPQAVAAPGGSIDPAELGLAEASDCDPDVSVTYLDEVFDANCAQRSFAWYIRRTWTATDSCGNEASCEQLIGQEREPLALDIKPGECPNVHNPGSRGKLHMALLGTERVNGAMINVSSLRLRRADCQAGEVVPLGPGSSNPPAVEDLGAAAAEGELCPSETLDGLDDLALYFDSTALDQALGLSGLGERKVVLMLTGTLSAPGTPMDGVEFVATDVLDLVLQKQAPQTAGTNPSPTRMTLEDMGAPPNCGTGMGVAMPLSMLGLLLVRRRGC